MLVAKSYTVKPQEINVKIQGVGAGKVGVSECGRGGDRRVNDIEIYT